MEDIATWEGLVTSLLIVLGIATSLVFIFEDGEKVDWELRVQIFFGVLYAVPFVVLLIWPIVEVMSLPECSETKEEVACRTNP